MMTFTHKFIGRGLVGPLFLVMGVIAACGGGTVDSTPEPAVPPQVLSEPLSGIVTVTMQDPGAGHDYAFAPSDLTFKVGQTVELAFVAESAFHTFTVEDLGIDVSVDSGTTERLSYTFNRAGTFGLICIPHERLGMVGTVTVVP